MPDVAQTGVGDIDQAADGTVALDNHVRTAGNDSRAAFAALKKAQCFLNTGRPMERFDALKHDGSPPAWTITVLQGAKQPIGPAGSTELAMAAFGRQSSTAYHQPDAEGVNRSWNRTRPSITWM